MRQLLLTVLAIALSLGVSEQGLAAVFEPRDFESAEQAARYKRLTEELRCLVCQNQNLADSNAGLAGDLRREVYEMVSAGRSDQEVVDFMVARYGDFVLYRPPFRMTTLALWIGPFVLALLGLLMLYSSLRRRRAAAKAQPEFTTEEQRRVEALLKEADGQPR